MAQSISEGDEFFLVLSENNTPHYDADGDVLVQRQSDGIQFYVNRSLIGIPDEIIQNDVEMEENQQSHWTKNEILKLIAEYDSNKENFASTSIKNIKVWQDIAKKIKTHSARQCENKFKYLKSKYLKKKDNMSNRSSGSAAVHFEYFEEFDQIFKNDPMVEPVAIASSSRDNQPLFETPRTSTNDVEREPPPSPHPRAGRRSKNIRLRDALINLNKILEEAEEKKERRHTELMELHRETVRKHCDIMEKILEKL